MNKKKEVKQKKFKKEQRVLNFLDAVDWAFGLNGYEKHIILKKVDSENMAAEIVYREDYQAVEIGLYPLFFTQTLKEQRKCLLHELCHAITLQSKGALHDTLKGLLITPKRIREINETETSKIENIIHRLITGGLGYLKQGYKDYLKPIK